jgi:hypothetical protein
MSTTTPAPAPGPAQTADHPAWHALPAAATQDPGADLLPLVADLELLR